MKNRSGWIIVGAVVVCAAVGAAWAAKKELTAMAPDDLKWNEIPETGGVQVAPVSGDMTKGKHTVFVKMPAAQVHPLHTHTSELKTVVISGTFAVGPEGGPEKKLGPGSYIVIPGGMKHTSSCEKGCVLFQEGAGKFDMKPVGEKPAAKKE